MGTAYWAARLPSEVAAAWFGSGVGLRDVLRACRFVAQLYCGHAAVSNVDALQPVDSVAAAFI